MNRGGLWVGLFLHPAFQLLVKKPTIASPWLQEKLWAQSLGDISFGESTFFITLISHLLYFQRTNIIPQKYPKAKLRSEDTELNQQLSVFHLRRKCRVWVIGTNELDVVILECQSCDFSLRSQQPNWHLLFLAVPWFPNKHFSISSSLWTTSFIRTPFWGGHHFPQSKEYAWDNTGSSKKQHTSTSGNKSSQDTLAAYVFVQPWLQISMNKFQLSILTDKFTGIKYKSLILKAYLVKQSHLLPAYCSHFTMPYPLSITIPYFKSDCR